jgi:hypothetical protein
MMCGGSRDDHLVMHMRPFSDDAQNLGGHSQICVVSCHGLEMPADMMDTGDYGKMTGKRSCSEEPLSGKRACTGHCVGVDACIPDATGDPRNPRTGKFKFSSSLIIYEQRNALCYDFFNFLFHSIRVESGEYASNKQRILVWWPTTGPVSATNFWHECSTFGSESRRPCMADGMSTWAECNRLANVSNPFCPLAQHQSRPLL